MPPHVAVGGAVKDQHRLLAQLYERRFGRGQSIAKANCVQRVSRWAPARSGRLIDREDPPNHKRPWVLRRL